MSDQNSTDPPLLPVGRKAASSLPSTDRPMVAHGDTELRIQLRPQGEKAKQPIQ